MAFPSTKPIIAEYFKRNELFETLQLCPELEKGHNSELTATVVLHISTLKLLVEDYLRNHRHKSG